MQWDLLENKNVLVTHPFTVEELVLRDRRSRQVLHPYHRLICPDWVNIVPVTPDHKVVLIRQSRAGSQNDELEVPGGVMDPHEKDATMTAARELEEETGYASQRILPLGSLNPNPAIQANRLHMFVALNCIIPASRRHFPDATEDIKVELVNASELETLVRYGKINSCLAALTVMLALKYIPS